MYFHNKHWINECNVSSKARYPHECTGSVLCEVHQSPADLKSPSRNNRNFLMQFKCDLNVLILGYSWVVVSCPWLLGTDGRAALGSFFCKHEPCSAQAWTTMQCLQRPVLSLLSGVMFELPGPRSWLMPALSENLSLGPKALWETVRPVYTATANIPQQKQNGRLEKGLIEQRSVSVLSLGISKEGMYKIEQNVSDVRVFWVVAMVHVC